MNIDKTYKLYVFDLDGTLADTKIDIARALQCVIEEAGLKRPGIDDVVSAIGQGAKKALQKLTGLDEDVLDPYVIKFRQIYDDLCCDNVTLYEGAAESLRCLKDKGAVIALVTMKFRSAVDKIIKALDIDIFDEVIAFDDAKNRKPDPETLFKMLEKYAVSAQQALMVGDSVTDLKYAKAAGVDVCIMEYGYGNMTEVAGLYPTYLVNSLLELKASAGKKKRA